MSAVKLNGDRVAGNNSILARDDGSFYDFNGSINYPNIEALLDANPELKVYDSVYATPVVLNVQPIHNPKEVTKASQQLRKSLKTSVLDKYLPFYDIGQIQSNTGTTYDGHLAVMLWRPTRGGAKPGSQYGLCQYRGSPKAKWMSVKGSDSKCVESIVTTDGPVYATFGMGDFLLLKSMGVNYICFGGDGGAKNSPYVEFMDNKVGTRDIRLIADNDESGKATADYLRGYGFKVKVFNWNRLGELVGPKMDLRDLAWMMKSEGGDLYDLKRLIEQEALYEA